MNHWSLVVRGVAQQGIGSHCFIIYQHLYRTGWRQLSLKWLTSWPRTQRTIKTFMSTNVREFARETKSDLCLVEEDIAPSDFESTDEEAEQQEAEQQVQNEERQARKAVKSRLEKATAVAHARQKATFNPEAVSSTPKPRRVILGLGEKSTNEPNERGSRKSKRTHTILSTSLHVKRMKRSEEQKVCFFIFICSCTQSLECQGSEAPVCLAENSQSRRAYSSCTR